VAEAKGEQLDDENGEDELGDAFEALLADTDEPED